MGGGNVPEVIAIGETMYCLIPEDSGPLRYARGFRPRVAGAESNLAIGLAKLGRRAAWLSRLGDDEFGHFVANSIRGEGVDTSLAIFDPAHRTGLMFKERTAGETRVHYYRENSAASHLAPDDVPEKAVADAVMLHITGITPILSQSCADATAAAMEIAERRKVKISFDANVRLKLWGKCDYGPLLADLALRSHLVMLGVEEAKLLFGTEKPAILFRRLFKNGAAERAAVKDGANGAWVADRKSGKTVHIPPVPCHPVEPIGAGDAFDAGFLAGFLEGRDVVESGRMGAVAGALATQTTGDIEGYPSRTQMRSRMEGDVEINR
ncbi:MAG: sugar kinase [Planctomycetota bacterium]|jgi:2-dehydro-3-deoxygluconokinase|nr:sugar kinase [Planctomycetota bacterium]